VVLFGDFPKGKGRVMVVSIEVFYNKSSIYFKTTSSLINYVVVNSI